MALLGAHVSVSGGLHLAFDRIKEVGGTALQLFTRSQRRWLAAPLTEAEIAAFRKAHKNTGDMYVAAHGSYLINLAATNDEIFSKSIDNLAAERARCHLLGIGDIVVHPGAHGGAGVAAGTNRVCSALDQIFAAEECNVKILLETTAGQGSGLGSTFEELAAIIDGCRFPHLLGFCIDTCHLFAAGFDIRSGQGYADTVGIIERTIGLSRVKLWHLNDSKGNLGSRIDRHEHIGKGQIGVCGFRHLLNDPRFATLPMLLETPKDDDLETDRQNLRLLRSLIEP